MATTSFGVVVFLFISSEHYVGVRSKSMLRRKLIQMLLALTLLGIAGVRACEKPPVHGHWGHKIITIETGGEAGFGIFAPKQ
jgi:hypothetical protein